MTRWLVVWLVVAAVALAGCGGGSSSASRSSAQAALEAQRAGPTPSKSAKMICAVEAQRDLAESLGVQVSEVTTPTWANHLYSCSYLYPDGSYTLSLKELNNLAETTAYYNGLGVLYGRQPGHLAIGQGAYVTTGGDVVVRKNFKVMFVDTSHLPVAFGQPPQDRADTGLSIAATILSCWSGD